MMWLVDSLGWTETLVLALIVITALYLRYGRGKAYNLPPGPWPLPVIGNVLTFALSKKSVFDQLTSLSEKYGPIFKVQFGGVKAVVLNNLTLANEALLTKPTDFAGRPHSYSMDIITQGGKDIALADYGPTWRLQRKIASKAFRAYLTGTQLELRVHKAVSDVIDVIKVEKGPLLVKDYLSLLVMNFICAFCFGTSYKMDDQELKDQLDVLDTFLETSANGLPEDFLPALRHLRLKGSTTLFKKVDEFRGFVEKHYKEHQGSFDSGNIRDFTDCLIAAEKEAQSEEEATELSKLTQIHFTQTLADIFSAGVDTSRYTLAWTILYCVAFPELQEKVHREIMAVVGPSRMPGINDKKKLPYTEAFLHESMRLGTVAPGGFPHCAMVDGQIGGYDVPKGFLVTINHWWLHHDPAVWPEPDRFRPERFLNEDGSLAPKPENFLPFSMGRRVCLGEAVAKPELLLMFAGLLHKLKFSLPPGETANLEPVGGLAGLIPRPYKVIVESRF